MPLGLTRARAQELTCAPLPPHASDKPVGAAVTRDGGAMAVPISDHIVIRGDAAFDTAIICEGAVFMLDEHLDRLEASAQAVGLALPEGGRDGVCEALLATAAAGGVHDGCLRYWLSSGPGGFGVARRHGAPGVLYAVVVEPIAKAVRGGVTCAPVPHVTPKPAPFCHAKTTNYLPNVVAYEQGKVAGADYGIFLAPNGDVLEAPTANVALLLPGGELRAPCPPPTATDGVLRGLTQQRVFALLEGDPQAAADAGVAACVYGRVTAEDVALAEEIMLMGGGVHVSPVTRWGGALVGSGEPGRTALALLDLIEHDMREGSPRTAVPYSLYDSLDA